MSRPDFTDSYDRDEFESRAMDAEADAHQDDVCAECMGQSGNCPFCCDPNRDADHAEIEANHKRQARAIRRKAGMR